MTKYLEYMRLLANNLHLLCVAAEQGDTDLAKATTTATDCLLADLFQLPDLKPNDYDITARWTVLKYLPLEERQQYISDLIEEEAGRIHVFTGKSGIKLFDEITAMFTEVGLDERSLYATKTQLTNIAASQEGNRV